MDGFKRINPTNVEAMQGTAAALAEMSVKEDELTLTAQVNICNDVSCHFMKELCISCCKHGVVLFYLNSSLQGTTIQSLLYNFCNRKMQQA